MNHTTGLMQPPRRTWPPTARTMAGIIAAAGLTLLTAACGGSPGGHVAQLNSTTTRTASSSAASNPGRSPTSQPLAFSRCIRSHGVSNFPDPNSSGVWAKSQVEVAAGNPRFQAATNACGNLLPDGGPGVPPSQAVLEQIQSDMLAFVRCMRSHGVPNWPDPSLDQGRAVFDPQSVGIDPNSAQISTKMHTCEHVFPASVGIPPGA